MYKLMKEIYGAGILFFYYMKYIILFGWPLLRFGLAYQDNIIMDILWVFCAILFLKDLLYKFAFKKSYCKDGTRSKEKKR